MTPLPAALRTLLTACEATSGLLDIAVPTDLGEQRFTTARTTDPTAELRARQLFSSSIIQRALASGEVVRTASAVSDPRFADRSSVQDGQILSVLCAPLGGPDRHVGVVYLERPTPFDDAHEAYVRGWCEGIAPLIARHVLQETDPAEDATAAARKVLHCPHLIGRSEALARTLDEILLARLSNAPVLITGPTGSGKSTLARIVHDHSRRSAGPFEAANAANLKGELLLAELFGVAPGAATSVRPRKGLLAQADGGTLFLDEIGLLPMETQAQLLTFLDSGSYRQLGRDRTLHADVRVIGATNEDLEAAVAAGSFRADLLFRLDVLRIRAPALSERREDLPLLADALISQCAMEDGLAVLRLTASAQAWLDLASWPGQVRELRACLHRGLLRAHAAGAPSVDRHHLTGAAPASDSTLDLREATAAFQRRFLIEALARHDGNRTATARAIGLSRSRLYELLDALSIPRCPPVRPTGHPSPRSVRHSGHPTRPTS